LYNVNYIGIGLLVLSITHFIRAGREYPQIIIRLSLMGTHVKEIHKLIIVVIRYLSHILTRF